MDDIIQILEVFSVVGPMLYMEAKEYVKRYKYQKFISTEIENRIGNYLLKVKNALSKMSDEVCYYVESKHIIPCESVIKSVIMEMRTFENNVGLIFEELTDIHELNRDKIIEYGVFKNDQITVLDKLMQIKHKNGGYIYPRNIISIMFDVPATKKVIIDGFKNIKKAEKRNPGYNLFPHDCLNLKNLPKEKAGCLTKINIEVLKSSDLNDKELVIKLKKLWKEIKEDGKL